VLLLSWLDVFCYSRSAVRCGYLRRCGAVQAVARRPPKRPSGEGGEGGEGGGGGQGGVAGPQGAVAGPAVFLPAAGCWAGTCGERRLQAGETQGISGLWKERCFKRGGVRMAGEHATAKSPRERAPAFSSGYPSPQGP
jgi:hypothetical protein